jgi:N-acetylated-alpha-linked acidic dipeptidase
LRRVTAALVLILALTVSPFAQSQATAAAASTQAITGFRDAKAERSLEERFLAIPSTVEAEQHLKTLTAEPHLAGTPEDLKTAEYVAAKFREAGLETRIDEYKVWMDRPGELKVEMITPDGPKLIGPTREHVEGDPFQDDPRVIAAFSGGSASADVTADVVYANYGRPQDFKKLEELGVSVKGKIVIVRYGENFRGVKTYIAQQKGAVGVIIYSDPADDGYFRGDVYPKGPFRPDTGIQRGSVQWMFEYPGDPTTPGTASVPALAPDKRTAPEKAGNLTRIASTPLSYRDAAPIMESLQGPVTPRDWQGALPFTYHAGPGSAKVHLKLEHRYDYRSIWNVIGMVRGSERPDEWVVAGNHRDAWVYGAIDPNSGTTAMLEAVRGIGGLLKSGWKPKRTIVFGSWDAEEEGLIGSTEFVEQFAGELSSKGVAYFNMDVAVSGPSFGAAAVPSLKQFVREVTKAVPAVKGGTVYESWQAAVESRRRDRSAEGTVGSRRVTNAEDGDDIPVGDLGSGSDYTSFLQHLGIPATDIGTTGANGVYHSAFDNFAFFKKFIDPNFQYEQQMARVFGLEVLRMAEADVLPFDYQQYGKEIRSYLERARKKVEAEKWPTQPDFGSSIEAADHLSTAGGALKKVQASGEADGKLNIALINAERALLGEGLPHRPFFKHLIYAPGEYTGYAAVVIPGVNEALDSGNVALATEQLQSLVRALNNAATILENGQGR